jgi:integrase
MATNKLTKAAIAALRAPTSSGKDELIWDFELKGFGVRLSGATNTRAYIAQKNLPDGRTRRVTVAQVGEIDLAAARSQAADLLHSMRHGKDPKAKLPTIWTLRTAMEGYLAANKKLKPASADFYRSEMNRLLPAWLDRPLATISPEMIEQRHREIQRQVARRGQQQHHTVSLAGSRSANQAMSIFGMAYGFAADRDTALPANPVRRLKRQWFDEPRRTRLVRESELPAFFAAVDALPSKVMRDYILLMLFTGMRRNEAALLKWTEIDFAQRVIRIPAPRTKSKSPLDLPMSSFVADLLIARRAIGRVPGDWVFPTARQGMAVDPRPHFEMIAQACNIEVSSHDLRRTFITVAESCDISHFALKALVNHALPSADVTAGYIVMSPERLREPAQRVCDRLMQLCDLEPSPALSLRR